MRPLVSGVALFLASCSSISQADRQLYAADLRDAIAAVTPFFNEEVSPYLRALLPIADAFESGEEINWSLAFDVVRGLEPQAREALVASGRVSEAEADALLAVCRMALRHIEALVL